MRVVFPIIAVFVIILIVNLWYTPILTFVVDHKWLLLISFIAIILYCSWAFNPFFNKHKQNLRRTWYFLFMIGVVLLLSETGFDTNEWQRYILLAGMFIFVDLALFLTPTIKKIGGAEMEQINEMESVNDEMKRMIVQTQNRSWQFTGILDLLDISKFGTQEWRTAEDYRNSLEDFLYAYGESCRQTITIFNFENKEVFKQEVGSIIGIDLNREEIKLLEERKLVHIDKRTIFIPFIEGVYPVIIAIEGEKDILDIDTDHLVNLSLIHSWLKKS